MPRDDGDADMPLTNTCATSGGVGGYNYEKKNHAKKGKSSYMDIRYMRMHIHKEGQCSN